jgi:hypothetical protein
MMDSRKRPRPTPAGRGPGKVGGRFPSLSFPPVPHGQSERIIRTTAATITGAGAGKTTSSTSTTVLSLQRTLEANRRVQRAIRQQIQRVVQEIQDNRTKALHLLQQLKVREETFQRSSVWPTEVIRIQPKQVNEFFRKLALIQHTKQQQQQQPDSSLQGDEQNPEDTQDTFSFRRLPPSRTKYFPYDAHRKWDVEYFIDPTYHQHPPEPNKDVERRQQMRGDLLVMTSNGKGHPLHNSNSNNDHNHRSTTSIATRKLPKDALQRLLKLIPESSSTTIHKVDTICGDLLEDTRIRIDWKTIQKHMNQGSTKQYTIWQLVSAYAQHSATQMVQENPTTVMNPKQDEFLLRYLALHGPQLVWDNLEVGPLCSGIVLGRLGDPVAGHQIIARSHDTSFNLKLTPTPYWKTSQERKLLLLMKIYQDTSPRQCGGTHNGSGEKNNDDDASTADLLEDHESPPAATTTRTKARKGTKPRTEASWAITQAATHFPTRTRDQVRRKWERSLDPGLDHQPFTEVEDRTLKQSIQDAIQSSTTYTMADVARIHFPNRKSHQIYARWLEIGTPEEIIAFDTKQVTGSVPQSFQLKFTVNEL